MRNLADVACTKLFYMHVGSQIVGYSYCLKCNKMQRSSLSNNCRLDNRPNCSFKTNFADLCEVHCGILLTEPFSLLSVFPGKHTVLQCCVYTVRCLMGVIVNVGTQCCYIKKLTLILCR